MKPVIAITTSSFAQYSHAPLDLLKAQHFEIKINALGRTLTREEAQNFLQGCCGVIAGTECLDKQTLIALPDLRAIARCGTGLDSVDIPTAESLGIQVSNTPDAPTQAVAELTLGVLLDLLRHISTMNSDVKAGIWKKRMGGLLCGKQVGIIGLGRIGNAVAQLCTAFGARVVYSDPESKLSTPFTRLTLEQLLATSDIVSLHCPLPVRTGDRQGHRPLLGAKELDLLPQGALLVNLARGQLIDEEVLAHLLQEGKLAGAALDVYTEEPYHGPLRHLDTVILTPHCASYAREARIRMETEAAQNLLAALQTT